MNYVSLLAATLFGTYAYRNMSLFFRLLFFQLLFYFLLNEFARGVVLFQRLNSISPNNQWVYNIAMLLETGMLLLAAFVYYTKARERIGVTFVFLLFVVVLVTELHRKGIMVFANYSYATESILITWIYVIILFEQFQKHNLIWYRAPIVFACVGILIYFIANVPYITLMDYFQEKNPHLNSMLFKLVRIFSNIRYFLLALAFWHLKRNVVSFQSQYNG